MKLILVTLLFTTFAWSKPTVLVSYFDPFGKETVNNSGTVAKMLEAKTRTMDLPFELKICQVQTKFDVSLEELRDCIAALPQRPVLVIGLGETGCDLKVELMGRNLDKTKGPDNAGIERNNTPIVKDAPPAVGFSYPLPQMYCALSEADRKSVVVSNNAGSFVCNNLAFQTAWFEDDLDFGFMHVPSHTCRNLPARNDKAVSELLTMLVRGAQVSAMVNDRPRLPVKKSELGILRREFEKTDKCLSEFYQRARAYDEKSLWNFFNPTTRMN